MTTGKTVALTIWTFISKVMSLLFNMLSRFIIAFLPKSKHLLISWLQPPSAVILEPTEIKSVTVSIVFPSVCHEVMGPDIMIFVFWMLSFKPAYSLSSFTFIKMLFSASSLSKWDQKRLNNLYSLQPKMEKLYTVSKNKTGSWLWLRSWTPYCQIQT